MRFKNILEKYGITQQVLAERMEMNRVSVSRLLSEKNDLRLSTIEKIARAIGCPVDELFKPQQESVVPQPSLVCPYCGKPIVIHLQKDEKEKD